MDSNPLPLPTPGLPGPDPFPDPDPVPPTEPDRGTPTQFSAGEHAGVRRLADPQGPLAPQTPSPELI